MVDSGHQLTLAVSKMDSPQSSICFGSSTNGSVVKLVLFVPATNQFVFWDGAELHFIATGPPAGRTAVDLLYNTIYGRSSWRKEFTQPHQLPRHSSHLHKVLPKEKTKIFSGKFFLISKKLSKREPQSRKEKNSGCPRAPRGTAAYKLPSTRAQKSTTPEIVYGMLAK